MLLHTKSFWPEAITHMVMPFSVAEAINMENNFTLDASGRTPLQKLTATDSSTHLRSQHQWRCPVCVLESKVQTSSKELPKWEPLARIGMRLGQCPGHAGDFSLALNTLSSPTFYLNSMFYLMIYLP